MAAADPRARFQQETTCTELYTDPVTLDWGHTFCLSCSHKSNEDLETACPEWKQDFQQEKEIGKNKKIANIVEMVKKLQIAPKDLTLSSPCEEHGESLQFFCETDGGLLCVVCRESRDHREHRVTPVKEAEQEYKVKLQAWLPVLKKEREYILLKSQLEEEEQNKPTRDKMSAEKDKIPIEDEQLHHLLGEKGEILTGGLEEMEKKMTMVDNVNITKLSNRVTSLNALITEIDKKCEEPALNFLKDVMSTLNRCNNVKFENPENVMVIYKVMVTLDPDTAHPRLLLPEGRRGVRWTDRPQPLPDTPKRYTYWPCVLGREGFTSGRHYWEVQLLQEEGGWAVGVAAESVNRKRVCNWSPATGIWAVRNCYNYYGALTSPETLLSPREKPLKLGVYLDYEGGRLSLYNADSMELLYTFQQTSFTERLFPYFYFGGTGLRLV